MLEEKMLKREEIYSGVVLHVVKDTVLLPNGQQSLREICLHKGAAAVIPLTDDGDVLMVKQFRYAHGRIFLEIPAGKLDSENEPPLECAIRELREETGVLAKKITSLGALDTTPALINEKIHLYLAEDLDFGECELDEDEFLSVERIPLSTLVEMVLDGRICDAKTQVAILKVARLKGI